MVKRPIEFPSDEPVTPVKHRSGINWAWAFFSSREDAEMWREWRVAYQTFFGREMKDRQANVGEVEGDGRLAELFYVHYHY